MKHAKILLQNVNKGLGTQLHTLLSDAGYTVLTIKNRRGLQHLASTFKPELLIIEGIPQDSPAVVKKLKDMLQAKVLATSCDDNKKHLLKIGFDECLTVPYQTDDVKSIIETLLVA